MQAVQWTRGAAWSLASAPYRIYNLVTSNFFIEKALQLLSIANIAMAFFVAFEGFYLVAVYFVVMSAFLYFQSKRVATQEAENVRLQAAIDAAERARAQAAEATAVVQVGIGATENLSALMTQFMERLGQVDLNEVKRILGEEVAALAEKVTQQQDLLTRAEELANQAEARRAQIVAAAQTQQQILDALEAKLTELEERATRNGR